MIPTLRNRRHPGSEAGRLAVAVLGIGFLVGCLATPAIAVSPAWTVRFNGGSQDAPADPPSLPQGGSQFGGSLGSRNVAVDTLGNIYVAGTVTVDPANGDDFLVEKYDAAGRLLWYRTLDGGSRFDDTATSLALSADAVYVTGESCKTSGFPCNSDFLTVKYSAVSGGQLWARLADGPAGSRDYSPFIAVDGLGAPFVAGTTRNLSAGNSTDFMTIKYNLTTGVEAWRSIASTPANAFSLSLDLVGTLGVGADGHVVVSGAGDAGPGGLVTLLTVKYNGGSGAQVWAHTANSIQNVYPHAIAFDGASNPIVVGETDKFGDPKFFTLKYLAANGGLGWMKNYNYAPAGGDEGAHDVAVDGAGNVYVTGRLRIAGGYTFHTVMYEGSVGIELWAHGFGTMATDDDYVPTAIAYSGSNNRLIVAGYHRTPSATQDFVVESLDAATGSVSPLQVAIDVLWDLAVDVAVDSAGNVILAGGSSSLDERDLVVFALSPSLAELWRAYDPDQESQEVLGSLWEPQLARHGVAVDSLGNTVVVGSTSPTSRSAAVDFLVQKYGPDGTRLWSRVIDGGMGDDYGVAVVLGGASAVYVTGWSRNNTGTGYDVLTLRLDSANGATVWQQRYNGAANNDDQAFSIALGAERVFVVGTSHNGSQYNFLVLGYPVADGNSPWVVTNLDAGGPSFAYDVTVGCRENNRIFGCVEGVYLTGMVQVGGGTSLLTVLIDGAGGSLIWGGYQSWGDAVGFAIAAFGNPSTVVATGRHGGNWRTTGFQGSSPTSWVVERDFDGQDDQAQDVAFDSAGNAFVSGFATQGPGLNQVAATVKYDATTGAELLVNTFGAGIDYDMTAFDVATDFAGNVYLGGSRFSRLTGKNDFAFVKFSNALALTSFEFVDSLGSDDHGYALAVEKSSGDATMAGTSYATGFAGDLLIARFSDRILADDFESGGSSEWSATVP